VRRLAAMALAVTVPLVAVVTLPVDAAEASHHHHHSRHHKSACAVATGKAAECASVEMLGHRGVQNIDEDTLVALRRDAKLGVRFEADTWRLASPDGTPNAGPSVVIHDPTLRRTVDPTCLGDLSPDTKVGEVTPAQWKTLCNRAGDRLPTLRQWIVKAAKWGVPGIMEIKYLPVDPAEVADWVTSSGAHVSFYVSPHKYKGVCNQNSAAAMKAVGMVIGLKVSHKCPVSLQDAADMGYSYAIGGDVEDPTYVEEAHALGLRVGNYNSRHIAAWTRLVDAGADMIIASHPKRLRDWLR